MIKFLKIRAELPITRTSISYSARISGTVDGVTIDHSKVSAKFREIYLDNPASLKGRDLHGV